MCSEAPMTMGKYVLYHLPCNIHYCLGSFGRGKANSIHRECGYAPFWKPLRLSIKIHYHWNCTKQCWESLNQSLLLKVKKKRITCGDDKFPDVLEMHSKKNVGVVIPRHQMQSTHSLFKIIPKYHDNKPFVHQRKGARRNLRGSALLIWGSFHESYFKNPYGSYRSCTNQPKY